MGELEDRSADSLWCTDEGSKINGKKKVIPLVYFSASKRWHIENVCAVTWEILKCAGYDNNRYGISYKVISRNVNTAFKEVGEGHSTEDSKDNITLLEGRTLTLIKTYLMKEELVTAEDKTFAQCALERVRVLQNKLHQAAKKDQKRTFGILYDKICQIEVLWVSWLRVQKNKGAPGIDGRTILAIKEYGVIKFLQEIQLELLSKKYKPASIKRVYIKKSNGKLRPLGIPTVKDRIVQGAVKLIIEPIFEANFVESSYGFRPKRNCQDAIKAVKKWVTYGYSTVIDADISSYFDTIDHKILLNLVKRRIRDNGIVRLITRWLNYAIFKQDKASLVNKGTAQGLVISPLLANIYLHSLDKYWQERHDGWNTKMVRYCDDFVILIRNRDPEPYMESLKLMLSKLKLELSAEKTEVVEAEQGFNFLGVRMLLNKSRKSKDKKFCYGFPTREAMKGIRNKIRQEVGKDYQPSLTHKIKYLNPILRGWANYYNWLNSAIYFRKIDKYVTRKLNLWNRTKGMAKKRSYKWVSSKELHNQGLYKMSGHLCYSW